MMSSQAEEETHDSSASNFDRNDEDEKLFLATGYRYSFAQKRGFPFPWCAKKSGRKGWIVRDFPPLIISCTKSQQHRTSTNGVEFEGWNEAKTVLRTRQILLQRFGLQEQPLSHDDHDTENNYYEKTVDAAQRSAIDNWFQKTPAVMKKQREVHRKEILQLEAEKKRGRQVLDLSRKQQKESLEMKNKGAMQTKKKKQSKTENCLQCEEIVSTESASNDEEALCLKLGSEGPESPRTHITCMLSEQQATVSSPARMKRKGTQPRRDNKYRVIERSFIENQSFLLLSPAAVKQTFPLTPTRMMKSHDTTTSPLPQSSPPIIRMKYKQTQPRKYQRCESQSSSIILGEDPLLDQMIQDIVEEFTNTKAHMAHGHLFDGGAVSALREAAMDMVVHNLDEKNNKLSANASVTTSSLQQLDHDDTGMEQMIEQLIGEVAHNSGCNFDGYAVEALMMAAREIVTDDKDGGRTAPVLAGEDVSTTGAVATGNIEDVKTLENSTSTYRDKRTLPLQLDKEGSNI